VIIFGFALNPGSMLVGGMAVISGLSFWGAIGAITGGVLLATIAYTITATVGVDYGLPNQVSMRMVYGLRGAKWVPSAHDRPRLIGLLIRPWQGPSPSWRYSTVGPNAALIGRRQHHVCGSAGDRGANQL
jgi:hypothetical protein